MKIEIYKACCTELLATASTLKAATEQSNSISGLWIQKESF